MAFPGCVLAQFSEPDSHGPKGGGTSGYVFPGKDEDEAAYLQKPFTSRELLVKVKQALVPGEAAVPA